MRLILVYAKRKKNSWLRVYDDFDGTARLTIRMAGWVEYEANIQPLLRKNVCKLIVQPGLKNPQEAKTKVSYSQWQKNYKTLVAMLKPLGVKVEGPFKKIELDQRASLEPYCGPLW